MLSAAKEQSPFRQPTSEMFPICVKKDETSRYFFRVDPLRKSSEETAVRNSTTTHKWNREQFHGGTEWARSEFWKSLKYVFKRTSSEVKYGKVARSWYVTKQIGWRRGLLWTLLQLGSKENALEKRRWSLIGALQVFKQSNLPLDEDGIDRWLI